MTFDTLAKFYQNFGAIVMNCYLNKAICQFYLF